VYAMCKIKRRRCAELAGEGMDTTQSSYEKLKARNVIQMQELATVLLSLQLTQQEKKEIETKCEVACKELQDTQRQKLEIASELELVRKQLHQDTTLNEENARLKRSIGVCRVEIEGLKASVMTGSDAYDGIVAKMANASTSED
jgi:hypothetical protein